MTFRIAGAALEAERLPSPSYLLIKQALNVQVEKYNRTDLEISNNQTNENGI